MAILFGTKVAATPLSLWERVGVRVQGICATSAAPLYEERNWKSDPRSRECFSRRKDLPGFPAGPIGGGRCQIDHPQTLRGRG
jgi:hypothetical protein